jgi:HTH-type transcriptional regulator / antitoxin HipB
MPILSQIKDLSNLIRAKRKRDHLTQSEAASLCGVGTRFLSDLENGKETVRLSKVLKVLRGLGLVLDARERRHSE